VGFGSDAECLHRLANDVVEVGLDRLDPQFMPKQPEAAY
jgi:hypothetical protein